MTSTSWRSEEGFSGDDADGPVIIHVDGAEVRESTWAGAYYCAHVLYVATKMARAASTSIARDKDGDPLVGFLHVPADAETGGVPGRARAERHATTMRIVAAAIAGIAGEIDKPRVLLTGFGPFAAVVSNPTGDFIEHDDSVARALRLATGNDAARIHDDAKNGARHVERFRAGDVVLGRVRLDVHDDALDPQFHGSLPWAVSTFAPHALIALGVHRASSAYRVELEPTNAGLVVVDGAPARHERGRPIDMRDPHNRALARAILRGAQRVGLSG